MNLAERLIAHIGDLAKFDPPTFWTDNTGISLIRKYPDGFASMYKVGVDRELAGKDNLKPLYVSVSYGKKIDDGISFGSYKTDWKNPIPIESRDEFFFDLAADRFQTKDNKPLRLDAILLKIEKKHHLLPILNIENILLRLKIWFWRYLIPEALLLVDDFLIVLLCLISGVKNEVKLKNSILFSDDGTTRDRQKTEKDRGFKPPENVEFFGFRANRHSVVFFATIHLATYWLLKLKDFDFSLISGIFNNTLLSICYAIFVFEMIDHQIPRVIRHLINRVNPKLMRRIFFKNFLVRLV